MKKHHTGNFYYIIIFHHIIILIFTENRITLDFFVIFFRGPPLRHRTEKMLKQSGLTPSKENR